MTTDRSASAGPPCLDDAAYLLGALDAAKRRAFEQHLVDCPRCQAAVAEMTPTTGALGRLSPEEGLALLDDDRGSAGPSHDGEAVASLAVQRTRRRRRRVALGMVAAGLVGALAATAVNQAIRPTPPAVVAAPEPIAMTAMVDDPGLTAATVLTPTESGTTITIACRYDDQPPTGQPSNLYGMYVTTHDGTRTRLTTWIGTAGTDVAPRASTDVAADQIASVSVAMEASDLVLLEGDVDT